MTSQRVDMVETARSYAPEATVAAVASTPMRPTFVAATAARALGSMTPRMGRSNSTRRRSGATALTVLHAMTMAFTPRPARYRVHPMAYFTTVSGARVPYGTRAVSPR